MRNLLENLQTENKWTVRYLFEARFLLLVVYYRNLDYESIVLTINRLVLNYSIRKDDFSWSLNLWQLLNFECDLLEWQAGLCPSFL